MRTSARELAASMVEATEAQYSGEFALIRYGLDAALADGTSPAEAIENKHMLDRAVNEFPRWDTLKVHASSPSEVRWLQSALIWRDGYALYGTVPALPSYLVGTRKNGRKADLLLHNVGNIPQEDESKDKQLAGQSDPTLTLIAGGVSAGRLKRAQNFMKNIRSEAFDNDHMNATYHKDTNGYAVHVRNIAGVGIRNTVRTHSPDLSNAVMLRAHPWDKSYNKQLSLSNEDLRTFGVIEQLGILAAGFGKSAEVAEIIRDRS